MPKQSTRWPSGSSAALREDVLRVLGVLKVATADQIQELTRPHLTYRHPTSVAMRTKAHRNAALDLAHHDLTHSEGATREGRKLWGLTPAGLQAAAQALGRPANYMGSTARGAAAHGAAHAMAVNTTALALLQPRPTEAQAATLPAVDQNLIAHRPHGIGELDALATEVSLPTAGTDGAPARGSAQADLVLTAPEHGLPALFVEVDRATMTPERVAAKIHRYNAYFNRTDKQLTSTWRQRWNAPTGHPVVAFVLTGPSQTTVMNRSRDLMKLLRECEAPFPVLGVPLQRLAERGPWGDTWWNAARGGAPAPLDVALQPESTNTTP
ncbi:MULTISPECIES: replication-relaxation family protein [unclassified Streptomyces]|uniref:replication-relaxation family protein n=1 Tax=unclassified Streptomyces TaxID=2593676 RepID=UPI000DBA9174|nr:MULTISPECIES: replication-relaxation family protein [unclassified Streptomyces]MYT71192.1 hypothetical protein [Streptomyces sp. SID8367]RAJ69602.1 protein involved in plasmid replication-relaxation [Streptomyces sp. PsTaAH-137]